MVFADSPDGRMTCIFVLSQINIRDHEQITEKLVRYADSRKVVTVQHTTYDGQHTALLRRVHTATRRYLRRFVVVITVSLALLGLETRQAMAQIPAVSFSVAELNVSAGSQAVVIAFKGATPQTWGLKIEVVGDFTQAGNCPATVSGPTSCTVTVTYKSGPIEAISAQGSLNVTLVGNRTPLQQTATGFDGSLPLRWERQPRTLPPTTPSAPLNLRATIVQPPLGILVEWDPPTPNGVAVNGYEVRMMGSKGATFVQQVLAPRNALALPAPVDDYSFEVRAFESPDKMSEPAVVKVSAVQLSAAIATTTTKPGVNPTPPTIPPTSVFRSGQDRVRSVTVTITAPDTVIVSWIGAAGATGYDVVVGSTRVSVPATKTEVSVSGLGASDVVVASVVAKGNSGAASDPVTSDPLSMSQPPNAAKPIAANSPSPGQVSINWSVVTDPFVRISGFTVMEQGSAPGSAVRVGSDARSATLTGVAAGLHRYEIRVVGANTITSSAALTEPVTVSGSGAIPGVPRKPTARVKGGTVVVRWLAPIKSPITVMGYRITSSDGQVINVPAKARSVIVQKLRSGTVTFTVQSVASGATSAGVATKPLRFVCPKTSKQCSRG
jgi:hypothetical protein